MKITLFHPSNASLTVKGYGIRHRPQTRSLREVRAAGGRSDRQNSAAGGLANREGLSRRKNETQLASRCEKAGGTVRQRCDTRRDGAKLTLA